MTARVVCMNRLLLVFARAGILAAGCGDKADKPAASESGSGTPMMVSFSDLKWTELPERKGMQYALLSGDPKTGAYTQIRKVPGGTHNPSHSHSSEIKNVIISGIWYTGVDSASARDFGPGSVVVMPANWVHESGSRPGSDCVFYQEGMGEFDFVPAAE